MKQRKLLRKRKMPGVSWFGGMLFMVCLLSMACPDIAKADDSWGRCSLESVVLEVGGKEYTIKDNYDSSYVEVEATADWKQLLSAIKVKDYTILADDRCPHVHEGDTLLMGGYYGGKEEDEYIDIFQFRDGKTTSLSPLPEQMDDNQYEFYIELKEGRYALFINFVKRYPITYDLDGGYFHEAVEAPTFYNCGDMYIDVPAPCKENMIFIGWEEMPYKEEGTIEITEQKPLTLKALWEDKKPESINQSDDSYENGISYTIVSEEKYEYRYNHGAGVEGPSVERVRCNGTNEPLVQNVDYIVTYQNTLTVKEETEGFGGKDGPRVVITGIGKYCGELVQEYTIVKAKYKVEDRGWWQQPSLTACVGQKASEIQGSLEDSVEAYTYYEEEVEYDEDVDYEIVWDGEVEVTCKLKNPEEVIQGSVGDIVTVPVTVTPVQDTKYIDPVREMEVGVLITKGSIENCSVSFVDNASYVYTGKEIKPEVIVKDGDEILEKDEDYKVWYAGNVECGDSTSHYVPTVTVIGKNRYYGRKQLTFTIQEPKDAPILTGVAETVKGKKDGKIEGLTTEMEYRPVSGQAVIDETPFTKVTKADMDFAPGIYEVRVAAKEEAVATKATRVTIEEGVAVNVAISAEQTGYVLTIDKETLTWEEEATVTFALENGYEKTEAFAIEAKNATVTPQADGTYRISKPLGDVIISVKGVEIAQSTPTKEPSGKPDVTPTNAPSSNPSAEPTNAPSGNPGVAPTEKPGVNVTATPSNTPSVNATKTPAKKGTKLTDKKSKGVYKVTKVNAKGAEVAYIAASDKKATKVSIPKTVTVNGATYKVASISNKAFSGNKKLTKVTIGANVTTIGSKAFYQCKKLKSVTIGKNVTTIGKKAFYGCKNLKNIKIVTKKLTSRQVKANAFKGVYKKATIQVPKSKMASYKKILRARGVSKKATIKK